MKYLWDNIPTIKKRIEHYKTILLLLDFDGTLSPIAPTPNQAVLPPQTKKILQTLISNQSIQVAIISGRSLQDIKQKVDLSSLIFAGNHGFEWEINNKRFAIPIPPDMRTSIKQLHSKLLFLEKSFKGLYIENKTVTISIHYRLVPEILHKKLKKTVYEIVNIRNAKKQVVFVVEGKKVLDIRPSISWTKGHISDFLIKELLKKNILPLVIFIGDDITDEDAFVNLKNNVTIKVGENPMSNALYYVRDTQEVTTFINWLSQTKAPKTLQKN